MVAYETQASVTVALGSIWFVSAVSWVFWYFGTYSAGIRVVVLGLRFIVGADEF